MTKIMANSDNKVMVRTNGLIVVQGDGSSSIYTDESYFTFDIPTQTITEYSNLGPKDVVIPPTIGGVNVLAIGEGAFNPSFGDGLGINSVVLPEDGFITYIGIDSFDFNNITEITIPASVQTIDDYAFGDNPITSIYFGEDSQLQYLSGFNNISALTALPENIPTTVTELGEYAFGDCPAFSVLDLPSHIEILGDNAFSGTALTEATLGVNITSIGASCFYDTPLESVDIASSSISNIPSNAFGNTSLSSIVLPSSLVTIEVNAFAGAPITSITIGSGVSIAAGAFEYDTAGFISAYSAEGAGEYVYDLGGTNTWYKVAI